MIKHMLAAAMAAVTGAHSFQFVGASGETALFVEDTSTVTQGDVKTVWVAGVQGDSSLIAKAYLGAYTLASQDIDCAHRTDAVTHLFVYGANGDILAERTNVYPTASIAPMSAGELVFNYVCKGIITTDKTRKMTSVSEIKDFGKLWLKVMDKAQALGLTP